MSIKLFADVTGTREIAIPEIGPGFWIRVRQELSVGEQRAMFKRAFLGQTTLDDGKVRNEYDTSELSFATVIAYLQEWSDKSEITPDTIKAMDKDAYQLIERAIEKHVKAISKNGRPAAGKRSKTSTSANSDAAISDSAAG